MNNEIKKYCEQCKFYSILGCQSTLICNDGNRFLFNKKTDDMQAHWIKHNEYHLNNLKNIKFENVYECSNCGHLRFDNPQGRPDGKGGKFCDECGFEMNMPTRKVINMNDIKHDWVWEEDDFSRRTMSQCLTEDYCKGWNDCYDAIMKKLEGLK